MSAGSRIKNSIKNLSPFSLFILIECIAVAVFLTFNFINHGGSMWSLLLRYQMQFVDYFEHLGFASAPTGTNIYELSGSACFPPLAYLMYGFLARLVGYQAEDPSDPTGSQNVGQNLTIFVLYNIICIVLLLYAVSLFIKKKGFVQQILFPTLLIFSYPVLFSSVQRGNSVLLVAILLSIALAWKDDPSKVKRESAMILIAVCAGLKIYPAVFGLLYLKEKRWKEAVRLLIYGAVLFFLPFVFFGGTAAVSSFFKTVFSLYGDIHNCSVSGFTLSVVSGVFGNNAVLFATIIQHIYLVFSLIAFFCAKSKRAEVLILSCLMMVYVASNWMYTCVYMLPALLMFFSEKEDQPIRLGVKKIPDVIAFIMFLIVFSRPFYAGAGYVFIYDTVIVLSMLYHLLTIGASVYRKIEEAAA